MNSFIRQEFCALTADLYNVLAVWWGSGQINCGQSAPPILVVPNAIDEIILKLLEYKTVEELTRAKDKEKIDKLTLMLLGSNGLTIFKALEAKHG